MKKSSSDRPDGFPDDFLEWMDSPEGAESMEALDYVFNALDGATVDPLKRKITWQNGDSLSIDESVELIGKASGLERESILSHLVGWLQMEYIPEGLNEKQMEQFEDQIENWLAEYESSPPSANS